MRSSKRTYNILALPLRLIWCVWWHGSMGMTLLPHASRLSRGCTMQLKGVSQQCQLCARTLTLDTLATNDHLHWSPVVYCSRSY
jgi:hypothetical protein